MARTICVTSINLFKDKCFELNFFGRAFVVVVLFYFSFESNVDALLQTTHLLNTISMINHILIKRSFTCLCGRNVFFFMYQPNDNHRQNVIVKRLHILRSSVYRFSFSIYTFSKKSIQIAWQQYYFHYCWFVLCKIWFSVVFIGSKSSSDDHVIYRIICNVYIFVVYFFNAFNASVYINSLIILVLD